MNSFAESDAEYELDWVRVEVKVKVSENLWKLTPCDEQDGESWA